MFCGLLKCIIYSQTYEIKSVIGVCKIAIGKVQGKHFGSDVIANFVADKYSFAKYQTAVDILVATVTHIGAKASPDIPITC